MRPELTLRSVVVMLLLAASAAAHAKEPTRKLVIYGERLAGPVELTDSATLALSNVYAGNFLDAASDAVANASALPRYEISFYLPDHRSLLARAFSRPRLTRAYVVYFAFDSATQAGYVYLPGAGDTWAGWNHAVIIRADREGHWTRASAPWTQRIAGAIGHARRRAVPACPPAGRGGLLQPADSGYREVMALASLLQSRGLPVLCAARTTLAGMLGARRAAVVITPLGPFAALYFPEPAGAGAVTVTSVVNDGQLLTVLRGPNRERPVDSLYAADKTDFVAHGHWLFDTFDQPSLRAAVATAVGAR